MIEAPMEINKYDLVYVRDSKNTLEGSVQAYDRPAVILQNNKGNKYSPTTIVAFVTSKIKREDLPTHIVLSGYNLCKKSMILVEQVATISKADIEAKIDTLRAEDCMRLDTAVMVSLGYFNLERK